MSAQDTGNLARGHKAAINNPRVSEEAKEHSRQVLDGIERGDVQQTQQRGGEEAGERGGSTDEGKPGGRVLGGYKATLKNPKVSGEAKEHAKEVLDDNDAL